jgi:hypothetical protein
MKEVVMPEEDLTGFNSADEVVVYGHNRGWTLEEVSQVLQAHGFMVSTIAIIETWTYLDEIDRYWKSLIDRV